jgi:hypothetical protein
MRRASGRLSCGVLVGLGCLLWGAGASAQPCQAPRVAVATTVGMKYCSDPAFNDAIVRSVQKIRQDVRAQRQAGKLIAYISTPISSRGGGHTPTSVAIAASVKTRLEKEFGGALWAMNPTLYDLPDVDGKSAGGGEYMVMFTEIAAGENGTGKDFDMVHFTGPTDMRLFFGCGPADAAGCVARWLDTRAATDEKLRKDVADDTQKRHAFLRYYALRASAAYSSGAHDEWNIFVKLNRKRSMGEQVAVYFDGRSASPAEMEMEISPGYEVR